MPEDEISLYQQLRETPQLFSRIRELEGNEFRIQEILRREYTPELVRLGLALTDLRKKAAGKFPAAEQMWFDRQGLEQSTAYEVAQYKAQRFKSPVIDLCCGIGADTMALSRQVTVEAVDLDPLKLAFTKWNLETVPNHQQVKFTAGDATSIAVNNSLVHLDPDRRVHSSSKAVRIEQYVPDLEYMQRLVVTARGGAIKLSPAVNFGGKFPDCEVELISLHGECKEATIWFGELGEPGIWRATSLPSGATLAGHPLSSRSMISKVNNYLYDPDPAIVRAGLVDMLAEELQLERTDAAEEYLTGEQLVESPFLRVFKVVDNLPFNEKLIKQELNRQQCGQLEIKCRHIPVNVDRLRKSFRLSGTEKRVLIICREEGDSRGIIAHRVT